MRPLALLPLLCLCAAANAVYGLREGKGPLQVTEEITDLGAGLYEYTYTIQNRRAVAPVWWWGVYLPFEQGPGPVVVTGFDDPAGTFGPVPFDQEYGGYPTVAYAFAARGYRGGDYVERGELGSLSFTAAFFDDSVKTFFADVAGEWTGAGTLPYDGDTQVYSYLGETGAVPEPASMAALGLGALALLRRRKRA